MIVRGDEVTLTKNELENVIIECSVNAHSKIGIDDISFIMMQGLLTANVVEEVIKKIFGEEKRGE